MTAEQEQEWEPGDRLYSGTTGSAYRSYLFNFRDDPETDFCGCNDAASWPDPRHWRLVEGDELGAFIAAHRRRQENSA